MSDQTESLTSMSVDSISMGSQFAGHISEPVSVVTMDHNSELPYVTTDDTDASLNIVSTDHDHLAEIVASPGGTVPIQLSCTEPIINAGQNEISDLSQLSTTDGQQLYIAGSGHTSLGTAVINGETVQIIQVHGASSELASREDSGKVWHLVTADGVATSSLNPDVCSVIAVNPEDLDITCKDQAQREGAEALGDENPSQVLNLEQDLSSLLLPARHLQAVPPGTPAWALRLNDLQKIGNSYRGWVATEVELDLLLTLHKQRTQSFWGTRQSPASNKPSTRLMWKSQYVPFDGVPFLNSGSRAVVMECQYGPRRKGWSMAKSSGGAKSEFRQTCPARIYIKRVKKFPHYAVDVNSDKKAMHVAMAKNFQKLKENLAEAQGFEKFFVELPTEKAHEFHDVEAAPAALPASRLDPRVVKEIRSMVSGGETRLYVIRKRLRKFVEKELFNRSPHVPEKHDLCFFPTVTDLQNHIHQAVKDIETGVLPATARTFTVEVSQESTSSVFGAQGWPVKSSAETPHAESVTVTLTQAPDQDGQHMISRVETHMSDGTTQISTSLTPETAKLLAKLHPNMFQAGSIFQGHEPDDLKEAKQDDLLPTITPNNASAHVVETLLGDKNIVTMGESVTDSQDDLGVLMSSAADKAVIAEGEHIAVSDIKIDGYDPNQTYRVVVEDGKVKHLVEVTDMLNTDNVLQTQGVGAQGQLDLEQGQTDISQGQVDVVQCQNNMTPAEAVQLTSPSDIIKTEEIQEDFTQVDPLESLLCK